MLPQVRMTECFIFTVRFGLESVNTLKMVEITSRKTDTVILIKVWTR